MGNQHYTFPGRFPIDKNPGMSTTGDGGTLWWNLECTFPPETWANGNETPPNLLRTDAKWMFWWISFGRVYELHGGMIILLVLYPSQSVLLEQYDLDISGNMVPANLGILRSKPCRWVFPAHPGRLMNSCRNITMAPSRASHVFIRSLKKKHVWNILKPPVRRFMIHFKKLPAMF